MSRAVVEKVLELKSCVLTQVEALRLPLVNRFYTECEYKVKCGRDDKVYALTDQADIIAAARLILQPSNSYLLRNVCVLPKLRHRGVASQLVRQVMAAIAPQPCYCYALPHLQSFYTNLGFHTLAPEQVPPDIAALYIRHQTRKRGWVLMGFLHEKTSTMETIPQAQTSSPNIL